MVYRDESSCKQKWKAIASIQQELKELTKEKNNIQKVLEKCGYEIINTTDDTLHIKFGNECRNALRVKIE